MWRSGIGKQKCLVYFKRQKRRDSDRNWQQPTAEAVAATLDSSWPWPPGRDVRGRASATACAMRRTTGRPVPGAPGRYAA